MFLQIIHVHSWILIQMSQELENLSRGLIIGQSAGEKLAKMTPINNVYWSYCRINRIKTLIVNIKSREILNYFKPSAVSLWAFTYQITL
jgi:hypothetical protein